jgi:hypothetical protein
MTSSRAVVALSLWIAGCGGTTEVGEAGPTRSFGDLPEGGDRSGACAAIPLPGGVTPSGASGEVSMGMAPLESDPDAALSCTATVFDPTGTWGADCADGVCKCSFDGQVMCTCDEPNACPSTCCPGVPRAW